MASEIRHLLSIARIVGETNDPAEAFRRICRELAALTGAETVAAYMPGAEGAEIRPIAGYHVPATMLEVLMASTLPLSEQGFAQSVFGAGRLVWSDDVQGDPRFSSPLFRRFPHQSGLILPLTLDGKVAGAFYLVWWRERRRFHDADVQVLQGIAELTGALVRHAQLYRQAEERRRRAETSEARFRALAHHVPAGIFQVAADGHCLAVNARWCQMTGLTPEEAERLGWLRPVHAEDRPRVEAAWEVAMREGSEFAMDFRLETVAGIVTTVSASAVPVRDEHGVIEAYLGTMTDITERHQAAAAVRASEARYRLLFEENPAGMFRIALDGRFLDGNRAFAQLVEYADPDEVLRHSVQELFVDAEDCARVIEQIPADGTVVLQEHRWRRADGSPITVMVSVHRVEVGGAPCLEGVVVDITNHKRADEALREAEQIQAVAQLALATAHEINNPLAVIMANLQILSLQGDSPHQERIERTLAAVRRVRDTVGRMSGITRLERSEAIAGRPEMIDFRKSSPGAGAS